MHKYDTEGEHGMKTRIVFTVINMNIGGTEKALLNMLQELPQEKFDITILMLEKSGGFLKSIPEHIHVDFLEDYADLKPLLNDPPRKSATELFRRGKIMDCIHFSSRSFLAKVMKNKSILFNWISRNVDWTGKEYDVAVAYAGPMDFISFFVARKIKAAKKLQWIHFDVEKIGFDIDFARRVYKYFSKIYIVSEEAESKFLKMMPEAKNRTEVFQNVISPEMINSQASEGAGFKDDYDGIRILTVGRLSDEKGQDLAVEALEKLVADGLDVRWYCLGDGASRKAYEQLISERKLEDSFILLGSASNPYPYIKACDIYVQPSRYEGFCITLLEARCLKKPIVSTKVNGVTEQIADGKTGLIVDIDADRIYEAVKTLIESPIKRQELSYNISKESGMEEKGDSLENFIADTEMVSQY